MKQLQVGKTIVEVKIAVMQLMPLLPVTQHQGVITNSTTRTQHKCVEDSVTRRRAHHAKGCLRLLTG
jgi:hypothetical protein